MSPLYSRTPTLCPTETSQPGRPGCFSAGFQQGGRDEGPRRGKKRGEGRPETDRELKDSHQRPEREERKKGAASQHPARGPTRERRGEEERGGAREELIAQHPEDPLLHQAHIAIEPAWLRLSHSGENIRVN